MNMASVEELEKRVVELEREIRELREELKPCWGDETPAERGARMRRRSQRGGEELAKLSAKVLAEMGIHGEPIGAEKVQEMMRAEGIKPEDNIISRGIIEMREEY
jgi:hypothetical protein